MITPAQCRAARGFLNWTLADLAAASGLSRASLNAFEGGSGNPKAETLARIRYAMEQQGMDFDQSGVRPKQELVRILKGADCDKDLMNDIFQTLSETGGEVLIQNANEKKAFNHNQAAFLEHMQRLKKHKITERLLVCEGDDFFINDPSCYRWVPKNLFLSGTRTHVYANKFAYKIWSENIIVLIQNDAIADAERKRFEYAWSEAMAVPTAN